MNLDDFNPDAPLNESDLIDLLTAVMINSKLDHIETALPPLVASHFGQSDWDFIDRLGSGAYHIVINMPAAIVMIMDGPVKLASLIMHMPNAHERFSPDSVTEKLQTGFNLRSPKMAKLINRDVITKVIHLCLFDWLNKPNVSFEDMQRDTHFYLQAVLKTDTDIDLEAVRTEAFSNMSAEDYANASSEVRASIDEWRRQHGIE